MKSYQSQSPSEPRGRGIVPASILIGGGAFLVGALVTFGYTKWDAQQQQMAQLAEALETLKQSQEQQEQVAQFDGVTRAAPVDLLAVSAPAQAVMSPPVQNPTPAAVQPSAPNAFIASLQPDATPALSNAAIQDARRLETLAVVHAGVEKLVAAVVAGEYAIHTNYEDEHFSGRIHFAFVGHEKDQVELENYLSAAAEAGIVAHSASVVDADGKVNGHILLFDLVERALENGTLEEQRAVAQMRREAVAMLASLAEDEPAAPQDTNAAGEQVYTVKSGDSLAYIALQYYGNTNDYVRIFEANRSQLRTPDRIRIGQRLVIPKA